MHYSRKSTTCSVGLAFGAVDQDSRREGARGHEVVHEAARDMLGAHQESTPQRHHHDPRPLANKIEYAGANRLK